MLVLVLGLVLFLGVHSVRIVADDWRSAQVAARGENTFKGIYSVVALAGLVLIVWGYGLARQEPVPLWNPPVWGKHLALLLMAVSFVVIAQMHGPVGRIKAAIHHPMLVAVIIWAVAHLIANGTLADLVLFGAVLVWALVDLVSAEGRERKQGGVHLEGAWKNDIRSGAVGLVLWAAFVFFLHNWLFGVGPLG